MNNREQQPKNNFDAKPDDTHIKQGENNGVEAESAKVSDSCEQLQDKTDPKVDSISLKNNTVNEVNDKNKAGKKKKKNSAKKNKQGPSKGIETMFKTAYRAQLDMISLGAAKANIMISINGFLATVLMISGVFIYAADPLFLPPTIVFLATAAISIFFAIQAASPGLYNKDVKLKNKPVLDDFMNGTANFLIYEHYANLSKDEYMQGMEKIIQNPEHVYQSMTDYLYWLGIIANWSSKMLRYSYLVFRVGIVLGITLLIAIQVYVNMASPPETGSSSMVSNHLGQFKNIYHPSGVEPLAGGQLLIIERQQKNALSIVKLLDDGSTVENKLLDAYLLKTLNIKIDELEALSIDNEGYVYAITSFEKTENGSRIPEKERIVQFKIENNRLVDQKVFSELGDYLESGGFVDENSDLSIKGLTFDAEGKQLLVGFRQPVRDGKAMLMVIKNPHDIFSANAKLKTAIKPVLLDLGGVGILSISYDPYLKGYLISSEPNRMLGESHSQLWYWKGGADDIPQRVTLPTIIDMKKIEGMSAVKVGGKDRLMIISDEGNNENKQPAHYMLLQYDQLIFE